MELNQNFRTLLKEAAFTKEILGEGATQIRKANYAQKGIYFLSFTSLSTGLERIGKLCLMLDYYIHNNGLFPNAKCLKNDIGHDLDRLYSKSKEIILKHSINLKFLNDLDSEIHQNILNILSNFAKGDRYSNIDFLVGVRQDNDPIAIWHKGVDTLIFDRKVSQKKKNRIAQNAEIIDTILSPVVLVRHTNDSGENITNLEKASYQTGFTNAVCGYRQLYILQIIRYWVELLGKLQDKAMSIGKQDIPYFNEIFAMFYIADLYLKTRKNWNKNF
jgi:hypothetical protein